MRRRRLLRRLHVTTRHRWVRQQSNLLQHIFGDSLVASHRSSTVLSAETLRRSEPAHQPDVNTASEQHCTPDTSVVVPVAQQLP